MKGIEIKNVTKRFGKITALSDVTVTFGENKIYGLLGRNGAGKSTLLNLITNRLFTDAGEITIDHIPAKENDAAQSKVYLMSEQTLFPETMRVNEVFTTTKDAYPDFDTAYAMSLAKLFDLKTTKRVKELSTGYLSIMKLIVALSVNCPYVLMDEPVLGLDANHRELFYKTLLDKYSKDPATYVLSTHLIEEVSRIVEDIVIIKDGKIIRNESREELLSNGYTISGTAQLVDAFCIDKQVIGVDSFGGLKAAYIIGKKPESIPDGMELTAMDLQKMFIKMTNDETVGTR